MKGFFHKSTVQSDSPLISTLPRCGACGLFKDCQSPKMKPYGEGKKRVLIVGDAPRTTEDEQDLPFVGKGGAYLREVLDDLGYDLDRDAISTNALICKPPNNATPDSDQISHCRPNLLKTIATHQPQVIITLGRAPLVSMLEMHWKGDIDALERWTGWQIPLKEYWLCPTFHPSYLQHMKNPLMDRLFKKHLRAAFQLHDLDRPAPPEMTVRLLFNEAEAVEEIFRFEVEGGWIAFDYESNCLKPDYEKAHLVCCSISNGERTIAYPWWGDAIRATGDILRSSNTRKIASNLKNEERWTKKEFPWGVNEWGWDTMLAAHCLDNRQGICSLKFQAFVKMGVETYNANVHPYLSSEEGHYNRIHEVEMSTLLTYCGMDSLLEYHLAMIQRKELGYC